MKKLFLSVLVFASLSCGKKKTVGPLNPMGNCLPLSEAYVNAANAYASDPTRQNCQNFLKTLDDLVKKCSILTAEQKREYQDAYNDVKCD